ncbi:MAG: sugar transporter permease [Bacilli bacterium]|nr:sugar transporter permease [Bacilli bacterium]
MDSLITENLNHTRKKKWLTAHAIAPYLFILPAVILIMLLSIFPIIYSFIISFLHYKLTLPAKAIHFVGLDNYKYMLTNRPFLTSIQWTLTFTFLTVCFNVVIGMILALMLNNALISKRIGLFKSLLILPMMLSPVVAATIWQILFGAVYGPINYFVKLLGFGSISWTGSEQPAKFVLTFIDIWGATPFCMLIFMAALKVVPMELKEAALIDGANRFSTFFRITLPLIRNFIALVVSIRIMDALRVFDSIMVLTKGGPGNSTETMGTMIYKTAFRYSDVGAGSAGAFIFFLLIILVTLIFLKLIHNKTNFN